jgi:hypothetical protein
MIELIISAVCAVLGTVLLVLGISGILAGVNYKNEIALDRTELLIDALMISFGIFLITF